MALADFDFSTPDLFSVVRDSYLSDNGLFARRDPTYGFHFVIADAAFYDLEVFEVTGSTFSGTAAEASTADGLRVVINGPKYSVPLFGDTTSSGPIIQDGRAHDSYVKMDSYYIGKMPGRGIDVYSVGRAQSTAILDPRDAPGTEFSHAVGSLVPLLHDGIPFGISNMSDDARITQIANTGLAGEWFPYFAPKGKPIYGLHRSKRLLFFLAQKDATLPGIQIEPLLKLLVEHNVSDAVIGDGSDSVGLVVDGVAEITPWPGKNATIPWGLALRLAAPVVKTGSTTITDTSDSSLAPYIGAPLDPGAAADFKWTAAGLQVTVQSLGGGFDASTFHLSELPVILTAVSGKDLAEEVTLQSSDGLFEIVCAMDAGASDRGTIIGTFSIFESTGAGLAVVCRGTLSWPLT
ncbi:MAG TPA: hypothetical protein VJZ71_20060 [Phycisphaerae bacterium]|nr:hypothetical protein [Phycisphaerae bacterium]